MPTFPFLNSTGNIKPAAAKIFSFIWGFNQLAAKNKFFETKDAYLGQTPPGDAHKIFAPGMLVNSGSCYLKNTLKLSLAAKGVPGVKQTSSTGPASPFKRVRVSN